MADEIGGMNFESGDGVRQDVNKVTEEAVKRVQENQKKAKQAQQAIQKDKAQNDKFAKFLTYILQHLTNDHLIKILYETFFKTKNPKDNLVYIRKNINTIVIVGMFAPFYAEEVKLFDLEDVFGEVLPKEADMTISKYINYLKKLSKTYHDNIPLDKDDFIALIGEILREFKIVANPDMNAEEKQEFLEAIRKEIYGK